MICSKVSSLVVFSGLFVIIMIKNVRDFVCEICLMVFSVTATVSRSLAVCCLSKACYVIKFLCVTSSAVCGSLLAWASADRLFAWRDPDHPDLHSIGRVELFFLCQRRKCSSWYKHDFASADEEPSWPRFIPISLFFLTSCKPRPTTRCGASSRWGCARFPVLCLPDPCFYILHATFRSHQPNVAEQVSMVQFW